MELNTLTNYNEFKEIKKFDDEIDLLLELNDYASNSTNFSGSLLGRGVNMVFKFLNKGKNFAKLYLYQRKFRNELAMGVFRTWNQIKKEKMIS